MICELRKLFSCELLPLLRIDGFWQMVWISIVIDKGCIRPRLVVWKMVRLTALSLFNLFQA